MKRAGESALGLSFAFAALALSQALTSCFAENAVHASPPQPSAPLPAAAEDPVQYDLKATLDPDRHTVQGEGTITWRNTSREPQSELYVHLYMNAFKSDRTVYARRGTGDLRWSAPIGTSGSIDIERFFIREMGEELWPKDATTPGDPDDQTDIRVPLSRAVQPGERITIDIRFTTTLPWLSLRTGYAHRFFMVAQWFPKLALLLPEGRFEHFPFHRYSEFYADFGSYKVAIDLPQRFVVGAVGRKTGETQRGDRTLHTFEEQRIVDFAFTAWEDFAEKTMVTLEGISIRCLFPKGLEGSAQIELETARFGLDYFARAYGAYPYKTLTIVHPPEWAPAAGGMEYPTLITTGGNWYLPWTGGRFLESVTLHELAHQWFYGIVATNEHLHPFLDEGLSTFAEIDALEARYPNASASISLRNTSLSLAAVHRYRATDAPRTAPIARPASAFEDAQSYAALAYSRTAILLLSIGGAYGMDSMRRALGTYARLHRFAHPGPADLERTLASELGPPAAKALHAGIYENGWVDYLAEFISSTNNGSARIIRNGTIELPVDIHLIGQDGQITRVRWDASTPSIDIPYPGPTPLQHIVVDPERRILLDDNLLNNAASRSPQALSPAVLERFTFAAELLMHLISP